jgi:hypothetical protein
MLDIASLVLKYVAYGVLLGVYGAFAWDGKTGVEGFIVILTGVIAALGASHVASTWNSQNNNTQSAAPPSNVYLQIPPAASSELIKPQIPEVKSPYPPMN